MQRKMEGSNSILQLRTYPRISGNYYLLESRLYSDLYSYTILIFLSCLSLRSLKSELLEGNFP